MGNVAEEDESLHVVIWHGNHRLFVSHRSTLPKLSLERLFKDKRDQAKDPGRVRCILPVGLRDNSQITSPSASISSTSIDLSVAVDDLAIVVKC